MTVRAGQRSAPYRRAEGFGRYALLSLTIGIATPIVTAVLLSLVVALERVPAPVVGLAVIPALAPALVIAASRGMPAGIAPTAGTMRWIAGAVACASGVAVIWAGLPFGWAATATSLAVVTGVYGIPALAPCVPRRLDALDRLPPRRRAVLTLCVILTIVQWGRVTAYMTDARLTSASVYAVPGLSRASAGPAAYQTIATYIDAGASNRADRACNVYAEQPCLPAAERVLARLGEHADASRVRQGGFQYPPVFLLLPRLLLAVSDTPRVQRLLWFAFEAFAVLTAFVVIVTRLPRRAALYAVVSAPLALGSFTTLAALQVGNYHVAVLMGCITALVLAGSGRPRTAGTLIAFGALTKVYPCVLPFVPGLVPDRRTWGAAAAAGTLAIAVTWALCGGSSFEHFVRDKLAGLASGHAYPLLADRTLLPGNFSIQSLFWKLELLGVPAAPAGLVRAAGMGLAGSTLVAAVVRVRARDLDRHAAVLLGLAVLNLVVVTTPWAPGYVTLGFNWLLILLPPRSRPRVLRRFWPALAVSMFCPDLPFIPAGLRTGYTIAVQLVGLGLSAWVLVRTAARARLPFEGDLCN